MATPGPSETPRQQEPSYTPQEAEELRCLDYHVDELEAIRDRGMITAAAFATLAAEADARRGEIRRRALARPEFEAALRLLPHDPAAAFARADEARRLDPSCQAAWMTAVEAARKAGDLGRARDLGEQAAARFPGFPVETAEPQPTAPAPMLDGLEIVDEVEDTLPLARAALQRGDDNAVVEICTRRLAAQPDHFDSIVLLAFARQRLGQLDEALTLYQRLRQLQPDNPVWAEWERNIARRREAQLKAPAPLSQPAAREPAPTPPPAAPAPEPSPTRLGWSDVAGEFLLDHWQKLILCLAVLLIVVSSNVGAYQLLGPKIWSPAGKCVLALVYTAMFAGFGAGLVRWGASRAGRIMLLTTLIVVPADFMLAGEMKLVAVPTASGLTLLAFDALALLLLIRAVGWSLGLKRGAWVLSGFLFALSAFNAAAAPGMPLPWGWQFAVYLAPAGVFLAAVGWLNARYEASDLEAQAEVTYSALGLFAFAFLTGVVRTGVFVLHLPPPLYAVPVMATAIALVQTSRSLGRFDADTAPAHWLGFGGLVLSALAFALALARPPVASPVLSGNMLATALLGLALYAAMLYQERQPAYLYLGFGALFLAYFGAFFFVADLVHAVEDLVRQALHYRQKLPPPFKAINGLVFNAALAWLSIHFRRRWGDARLARHCHYIGVPFSVACCVFSAFEPKAAVICLSGYAALYAAAVAVFAQPRVIYLAAGALAGAAYFGSSLVPGTTLAGQALLGALIGLGEWALGVVLSARGAGRPYRLPLTHAALAMSALATGLATASALPSGPASPAAAAALFVVALVAVLTNRDEPSRALAYLAALAGSLGYAFLALRAGDRLAGGLTPAQFAAALGSAALVLAVLGERMSRFVTVGGGGSLAQAVYPGPLTHVALAQVALAAVFGGIHLARNAPPLPADGYATLAAALALSGTALAVLTRVYPLPSLAHLALACGLGVWVALVQWTLLGLEGFGLSGGVITTQTDLGAAVAGYSLLLLAAGEAARAVFLRRKGKAAGEDPFVIVVAADVSLPALAAPAQRVGSLFAAALPDFLIVLAAAGVGLTARPEESGAKVFTLASGSASVLSATRARRSAKFVGIALWLAAYAALSLTDLRIGYVGDAGVEVGNFALTAAGAALVVCAAGIVARRVFRSDFYPVPCFDTVGHLAWFAAALAVAGSVASNRAYPLTAPALATCTAALLLLTTARPFPSLTYRAIASSVLAVYVVIFSLGKGSPETAHVPGLIAVVLAIGLQALGFAGRARAGAHEDWEWLYLKPLFRSALVLTTVGALLSYWSPAAMLLAGLSFLLMVKGMATRFWLYAAVASWCAGLYFGYLVHLPPGRLVEAAMVVAYQLWLAGLLIRRAEPALVRWLRLPGSGYFEPLFHCAIAAAAVAVVLRVNETFDGALAWTDSAGLAWNLAVFALLMTKAYPTPEWVHAAVVLASTGVVMAAEPRVGNMVWWVPVGAALSVGWQAAAWGVRTFGDRLGRWLGVERAEFAPTFDLWSKAFFSVATASVVLIVMTGVLLTVSGSAAPADFGSLREWWAVLLAIGLGAVFVAAAWGPASPEAAVMGLSALLVLAVWWLGAPVAPSLERVGLSGQTFLPLATAAMALGFVAVAVRLIGRPGWPGPFWRRAAGEGDPRARLDAYAAQLGGALAIASVGMTLGAVQPSTVVTFVVAAAALGLAAVTRGWVASGYASGLVACASGLSAALVTARRMDVASGADRVVLAALGLLAAVAVLWVWTGWLRRRDKAGAAGVGDPSDLPARSVVLALEQVALLASIFCAAGVVSTVLFPTRPADRAAAAGVAVLAGLTLIAVGLLRRWGAAWLVYAAQSALLGSYLYYRWAFPLPAGADAAVLTLFGYLDFGLAEAMHRVGLGRYAGPTRRFALAVPLVPLALAFWGGPLGGSKLFLLFAAATFYGVACARLQSRPVGYAAAVLYNAALWLLWSQVGWTLADRPQFFLVPVGLTAVLFAEVNRGTLDRAALNAIRGVGLTVTYLSLAVPVWQFESLGSWLALLLLSLAGIFAGIGLRVQTFLWLGLASFVVDVVYQLGRVGMENTLAKWGIMLALGIALVLFVALNEKKRIVSTLRGYIDVARTWE
jgi:hypothetical protein